MSDPVSALDGRVTEGFVTVTGQGPRGMITLRGDLASAKLKAVCKTVTGVAFPGPGEAQLSGEAGLAWMSPDEVLVMVAYADVRAALDKIHAALNGQHYLAADVSDARAAITLAGAGCREVLAKLCPADVEALGPGQFRRTRMGQIAAAFWMRDETTIEVVCFRSVADYAFDLLSVSVKAGPVGYL